MLISKLKQWLGSLNKFDSYVEGLWADQYQDSRLRSRIQTEYQARYQQQTTPLTHPWLFDPLNPPQGWRYDPYYEMWITHTTEE
jgi:hypothetical protein